MRGRKVRFETGWTRASSEEPDLFIVCSLEYDNGHRMQDHHGRNQLAILDKAIVATQKSNMLNERYTDKPIEGGPVGHNPKAYSTQHSGEVTGKKSQTQTKK